MNKHIVTLIFVALSTKLLSQCSDTSTCYAEYLYPSGFPIEIEQKWVSDFSVLKNSIPLTGKFSESCNSFIYANSDIDSIAIYSFRNNLLSKKETFGKKLEHSPFLVYKDFSKEEIYASTNSRSIFLDVSKRLRLDKHSNNNNFEWTSNTQINDYDSNPSVVDFNSDGIEEIYRGNKIFSGKTGKLLFDLIDGSGNFERFESCSAAQFDQGNLELICGHTIYKLNFVNPDSLQGNSATPINFEFNGRLRDGKTSIADINNDGKLDVIVSHKDNNELWVYAYSLDNSDNPYLIASTRVPSLESTISQASIGIIDNSFTPSILISSDLSLRSFKYDGTTTLNEQWRINTTDDSGQVIATLYDLNNDGNNEIIYRDETELKIFDGTITPPVSIASLPCISQTLFEYPIIADIDNSGEAKICVTCEINGVDRLVAFGSPDTLPGWTPARSTWNQYNYHPLAINEDGTVPQYMPNWATHEGGRYNNFFQQATMLDSNGMYRSRAASLGADITCIRFDTLSGSYEVTFDLYNRSDASRQAEAGLEVSLYNGSPEQQGSLLSTYTTAAGLDTGDTLRDLTMTISVSPDDMIYLIVNSSRDATRAWTDDDYTQLECD